MARGPRGVCQVWLRAGAMQSPYSRGRECSAKLCLGSLSNAQHGLQPEPRGAPYIAPPPTCSVGPNAQAQACMHGCMKWYTSTDTVD